MSGFGKLGKWLRDEILPDFRKVSGQAYEDDLDTVHELLIAFSKDLWASKGGSGANGPWRPRKNPAPGSLMDRTGRLKRSLTVPFHPDQIFERRGDLIKFGTRVRYAHFHQRGTRYLPKRRVVDLTDAQVDEITEVIADAIVAPIVRGR